MLRHEGEITRESRSLPVRVLMCAAPNKRPTCVIVWSLLINCTSNQGFICIRDLFTTIKADVEAVTRW